MDKLLSSCFLTWPIYLKSESAQKLTSRWHPQNSLLLTGMQDVLTESYKMYACGSKPSTISPVGEAWRIIKNEYPEEFKSLYTKDGSHPAGIVLDH